MPRFWKVIARLIVFRLIIALLSKYIKSETLNMETLYIGEKGNRLLLVQQGNSFKDI